MQEPTVRHDDYHHDHHDHHHEHENHQGQGDIKTMALSATLHCLTGCAIGEVAGLVIGSLLGLSNGVTIILAILLAFIFGYSLSIIPLLKSGLAFKTAFPIILAADSLSILTMEVVDNAVVAVIPGAMNAGLVNPIFWLSLPISLIVAFWAAYPVNLYLLQRGKGHALVHEYH